MWHIWGGDEWCTQGFGEETWREYHLQDLEIDGRILNWIFKKWEGGMHWINLFKDRDSWQALIDVVMNFWVAWNVGNFFISWVPVCFSRSLLHYVIYLFIYVYFGGWDDIIDVGTELHAAQLRKCSSTSSRVRSIFSHLRCPDSLWDISSLLFNKYQNSFTEDDDKLLSQWMDIQ
jgi:hypothetical protein